MGGKITMLFSEKIGKQKNQPVKTSVIDTMGTMLFLPRTSKAENHPVRNGVNGTRVQCFFPTKEEELKPPSPN